MGWVGASEVLSLKFTIPSAGSGILSDGLLSDGVGDVVPRGVWMLGLLGAIIAM